MKTFRDLFNGEEGIEPWLARYLSRDGDGEATGVATLGTERNIHGITYETYTVCQPHNCYKNVLYVLFEPGGLRAWALFTKDDNSSRWFGKPDGGIQNALRSLQGESESL